MKKVKPFPSALKMQFIAFFHRPERDQEHEVLSAKAEIFYLEIKSPKITKKMIKIISSRMISLLIFDHFFHFFGVVFGQNHQLYSASFWPKIGQNVPKMTKNFKIFKKRQCSILTNQCQFPPYSCVLKTKTQRMNLVELYF